MTELFSSRMAAEIDLAEDAYIIESMGSHRVTFHLAPLGLMNSISFIEGETSVTPSRDFSHVLYKYLRSQIVSSLCHTNACAVGSTNDEVVRNRQVEVFISLVLDVKQSGASSLELAAPALHALQMSLQSQLQPTNVFTTEFLSVLVSLLNPREGNEHEFHSKGNSRSNSRNSSSSRSTIAEDLISMILHKLPWNSDLLLEVLFSSLKYDSSQVYSTAQISILSQALGTYFKTSLPYIITKHVRESKLSSKQEVVGKNRVKADELWRNSLTLGDTLEATTYIEDQSTTSIRWVTATIVNIDYRSNTLTLEYLSTSPSSVSTVNDKLPDGTSSSSGSGNGKSSKLLQVSRINSSIRPIGSQTDTAYIHEFPELNQNNGVRTSLTTPSPFYSASAFTLATASASNTEVEVEVESEDDIQYLVEKNHKLRVDLIFKSMNNQKWTGLDGFQTCSISNDKNKFTVPKCRKNHNMTITLLSDKSEQNLYSKECDKCHLKCYQCTQISQINKLNNTKGWYCESCNYLLCLSCQPLQRDDTQFSYLNGPKGDTPELNSVEFKEHQNIPNTNNYYIRSSIESGIVEINRTIDSSKCGDNNNNSNNDNINIDNDHNNKVNDVGNNSAHHNNDNTDFINIDTNRLQIDRKFCQLVNDGTCVSDNTTVVQRYLSSNEASFKHDQILMNNKSNNLKSSLLPDEHVLQYSLSSCTSPEARTPTPPLPKKNEKNPKDSESLNCNINHISLNDEIPKNTRSQEVQDPHNNMKDNYSIANLVELSILLDKARKDQILNSSKNVLSNANEKQAGVSDVTAILTNLLSSALIVFEKVIINSLFLVYFVHHCNHYYCNCPGY